MIDFSRLKSEEGHSLDFEGQWHAIEYQPELDVPQRFVIGVAISQRGRLAAFRIAQEAPKLQAFYGQRYSKEVWAWLRSQLNSEFQPAMKNSMAHFVTASPQVHISEGWYTSGSTPESALNRTFERIVTVVKGESKARSQGLPQFEVREKVALKLKSLISTKFEQIRLPPTGFKLTEKGEEHTFDISYDNNKIASSIVSASYASLSAARLNVMQATSDLYRFKNIKDRERIGLAVLLPSTNFFSIETVNTWDDWWANESYKYKEDSSILIAEASKTEDLAEQVASWYD